MTADAAAGSPTDPDRWLRAGVAVTTAFGLATLVAAGLLPFPVAGITWGLALIGGQVSAQARSPVVRSALRVVGLGLAAVVLAVTLASGLSTQGLGNLGGALALALCALIVGQALAQRSRHDRLVALLLAGLGPVLAAGLAPGPRVMVPALACWLSLATTLAAAQLLPLEGSDGVEPRVTEVFAPGAAARRSTSVVGSIGAVVAASTALGLVVFLLVPRPPGLALLAADGGDTPLTTRAVDNYSGQHSMDLRSQGGLPDDPLFLVPADAPPLWRGTVLAVYDDGAWLAPSADVGVSLGSGHVSVPQSSVDAGTAGRPLRSDRVTVLPQAVMVFGTPPVLAPGRVVAVDTTEAVTRQSGGGLALGTGAVAASFRYRVTSVVQPTVSTPGGSASASWTEPDPQVWLQLPWNLPPEVMDLAHQLIDPAPTRTAAVAAVEDYLRAHEQYTLNPPVASAQQDPVDYFLFGSHLGFCEQFAAAEAVLLRSAGIPARVVTGFAVGAQPQPGDVTADGRLVVRANQAHAWVEVWLPGVGWATSDPTQGAVPAAAPFDPLGAAGRWLQTIVAQPAKRMATAALIVVVAALVVAVSVLRSRRRPRRSVEFRGRPGRPTSEPFAAFERLERRLAGVGRGRQPSETPVELLDRLPARAREPLEVVERASYASRRPGSSEVATAAATLDDLPVGERRC